MQILLNILASLFFISIISFLLGFILIITSIVFHIKVDKKEEDILNALPGANCGACGYPGCAGYAKAIFENENTPITLCSPGGNETIEKLSNILGRNTEGSQTEKKVAKVFCMGDSNVAKFDYIFNGADDCVTINALFNGDKSCKYSCIGRGDCIKVCPVDAIKRDSFNRVWIDSNICIGCEKCLKVCPTKVIKMVPLNGGHFVACSSYYDAKTVKEYCKRGCIGCKICEKITDDKDRIEVVNNLAVVKYTSNIDLHPASMKCPVSVIIPIKNQQAFVNEVIEKIVSKK